MARSEPGDRFGLLVTAVGLLLLAALAWLYDSDFDLYRKIMAIWMGIPFRVAFLDLEFVTAGVACWGQGADVYVLNPCDTLGRPHNYSPLLLRLSFLPTSETAVAWMGLGLIVCFVLAAASLSRSRPLADRLAILAGLLSPSAAFGMERGNLDLAIFCCAVAAAVCLRGRLAVRLGGYALLFFAGLAKFYPLLLLIVILKERRGIVAATGLATAAGLVLFFIAFGHELPRMAANIPTSFAPGEAWGAKGLPWGLATMLPEAMAALGYRWHWPVSDPIVAYGLLGVLTLTSTGLAIRRATRSGLAGMMGQAPAAEQRLAVIGAVLVCVCFFFGQSQPYRAVFLLLTLPALLSLARCAVDARQRAWCDWAAVVILLILWQLPIRRAITGFVGGTCMPVSGAFTNYIAWVVLESAWWWLIGFLMTIPIGFLLSLRPDCRARLRGLGWS